MNESCDTCRFKWEMEDWKDYPHGQYFRPVCGLFAREGSVMALYGRTDNVYCEEWQKKKDGKEMKND